MIAADIEIKQFWYQLQLSASWTQGSQSWNIVVLQFKLNKLQMFQFHITYKSRNNDFCIFYWVLLTFIIEQLIRMYTQPSNPKPVQLEMQRYPNQPNPEPTKPLYTEPKYQEQPARSDLQDYRQEPPSYSNYFLHICVFLAAFGFNLAMWAIDYFAVGIQASYYYSNALRVSSYTDTATYTDSTQMFTTNSNALNSPVSIAMSLIYSWILWKLSLIVFAYQTISREEGSGLRIGTTITLAAILLVMDVLLTIFALSFYNDYIFYGIYSVLAVIVAAVNCKEKVRAIGNLLIPLGFIAFIFFTYVLLLPSLYKMYNQNLSTYSMLFLIIYSYPIIDLIIYSGLLLLGTKMEDWLKGFFSSLHYLLLGYGVGMIMIVGYTEVEFYYLIAYFIFRNIFVNHIMRGWEKVVANPPALPGWIVCYYFSYALSFLPVVGVGKIVVAKSFASFLFALASTVLYGTSNPLYPSTTAPSAASNMLGTNINMNGNIYWLAAAIIWVGMTFTQRYHRLKPNLYDLFYYLFGIHLFYLGITCSLSLPILYSHSTLN